MNEWMDGRTNDVLETNDSSSVYVHQLQATNGMIHAYQTKSLPKLLEVSLHPSLTEVTR